MSVASTVTQLTQLSHPHLERPQQHGSNDSNTLSTNLRTSADADTDAAGDDQAPDDAVEAIPDGGCEWTVVFACATLLFGMNGYNTTWGVLQIALLKSSHLQVDFRTITFVGSLSMAYLVAFGLASVRLMRSFGMRYTCLIAVGPIRSRPSPDQLFSRQYRSFVLYSWRARRSLVLHSVYRYQQHAFSVVQQ